MNISKRYKQSQVKWLWKVVLVVALMSVEETTCQYSDACRSINGKLGTCVPLNNCGLFSGWLKMRPLVKEKIRTVIKYTCYFDSVNPKVCCPNEFLFGSQDYAISSYIGTPVRRGISSNPANNKLSFPEPAIMFPTAPSDNEKVKPVSLDEEPTRSNFHHHSEYVPLSFPSEPDKDKSKAIWSGVKGKEAVESQKKDFRNHPNFKLIPKMHDCSNAVKLDSLFGTYGAYPWIALVGVKRKRTFDFEHVCGGVIINERYILTSAHCFDRANSRFVRLGEYNLDTLIDQGSEFLPQSRREDFRIEKLTIHPDYNAATASHDIALIRVEKPISLNTTFIRAICLPFATEYGIGDKLDIHKMNELEGKPGWIAGFSRHSWDGLYSTGSESRVLQEGIVEFTSHDRCRQDYPKLSALNARSQLCVGGKGRRNSCVADSGGPLMLPIKVPSRVEGFVEPKFFLLGLQSHGPTGNVCQNTGEGKEDEEGRSLPTSVFTRVSKYLGWILDNMQE